MMVCDLFLTAFADSVQSSVALFDKPKNALFGWVGVGGGCREKWERDGLSQPIFTFWAYGW